MAGRDQVYGPLIGRQSPAVRNDRVRRSFENIAIPDRVLFRADKERQTDAGKWIAAAVEGGRRRRVHESRLALRTRTNTQILDNIVVDGKCGGVEPFCLCHGQPAQQAEVL